MPPLEIVRALRFGSKWSVAKCSSKPLSADRATNGLTRLDSLLFDPLETSVVATFADSKFNVRREAQLEAARPMRSQRGEPPLRVADRDLAGPSPNLYG
jgi:hypothetical protein